MKPFIFISLISALLFTSFSSVADDQNNPYPQLSPVQANSVKAFTDFSIEANKIPGYQDAAEQAIQIRLKIEACEREGNIADFCVEQYKAEYNAASSQEKALINNSIQQGNTKLKVLYDNLIKSWQNLGRETEVPANPQSPPSATQDKKATYMALARKLSQEAMKLPEYTKLASQSANIMLNVMQCRQNGGDPKTCVAKYQTQLKSIGEDIVKVIKNSINQGNTNLKDAYDNLNNFAKQNGMQPLD